MKIIIDGLPVAQIRMKYSGRHGIGRIYDPREKQKRAIKQEISKIFGDHDKLLHPRVSFIFHMAIPRAVSRRELALYHSGLLKHDKKPDVDNFIKLYLDCMDNIVFDGDQKVTLGPCVKLYHPFPKTIILVNEMQDILNPHEIDPLTWFLLFGKECGTGSYAEMACLHDSYSPTELKYSLCDDMNYLMPATPLHEVIPSVQQVLQQATLASKTSPNRVDS